MLGEEGLLEHVLAKIRHEMKVRHERPEDWARQCFGTINHVSHVLIECEIPHMIVVGNIKVDGRLYYPTTPESLARDMEVGYEPGVAANAHTWVKLQSGTIIDAGIIPSLSRQMGRRIKWNEAIYTGSESGAWCGRRLAFVPMIFGLDYYRKVVIATNGTTAPEHFMERYAADWQEALDELNGTPEF